MNNKRLLKLSVFAGFFSIIILSMNVAAETKMYKWVDSQGRISYQDKPPPRNSKILKEETLIETKGSNNAKLKLNTSSIDVYITADCPSCDSTVAFLKDQNIPYQVKMIEDARDIQAILIEKTNGVRVPALFTKGQLIAKTSTREDLKASLISTGHINPTTDESDKSSTTEEQVSLSES